MHLRLPYPPSANRLWRSVNGRAIKSKEYRQWRDLALQELAFQGVERVQGDNISVEMVMHPPDKRRRDVDNPIKACMDLLREAGVYEDDSQVCFVSMLRGEVVGKDLAGITVTVGTR